jgi:general stress protein YciG
MADDHTPKEPEAPRVKARRGFACLSLERRREAARKGGASVPAHKRSFSRDKDLAAKAGSAGGRATRKKQKPETD